VLIKYVLHLDNYTISKVVKFILSIKDKTLHNKTGKFMSCNYTKISIAMPSCPAMSAIIDVESTDHSKIHTINGKHIIKLTIIIGIFAFFTVANTKQ